MAFPELKLSVALGGMGIAMLWLMAVLIFQRKQAQGILLRTQRALGTISHCNQALVRAGAEPELAFMEQATRAYCFSSGRLWVWGGSNSVFGGGGVKLVQGGVIVGVGFVEDYGA